MGPLLFILLLFLTRFPITAQRVSIKHYSVNDGLISPVVNVIFQDSLGYLWFGTESGVSRFDGIEFHNISKAGDAFLENIFHILEDRKGRIWLCSSGGGVFLMDGGSITSYGVSDGLPNMYINTAYEDKQGTLWFGTEGGLCKFNGERFIPLYADSTRAGVPVIKIRQGRNGALWIATNKSLEYLHAGRTTTYNTQNGLLGNWVRTMELDRQGHPWIGSNKGLNHLKGNKMLSYTEKDGLAGNHVRDILVDRNGMVWLATDNGISYIESGKFINILPQSGLPTSTILSLFQDKEGNIWFSSINGAGRILSTDIANYTIDDGLPNDTVWSIIEGKNRDIWIGTDNGLSRLAAGAFKNYTTHDGLPGNAIYSLLEDSGGNLWIGTSRGISVLSNGRFYNYDPRHGLVGYNILSIAETRSGDIWIGSAGGISILAKTPGSFPPPAGTVGGRKIFTPSPYMDEPYPVSAILERRSGEICFSGSKGLYIINSHKLEEAAPKSGEKKESKPGIFSAPLLPHNFIHSIYEDGKNRLWIGTRGGLCLLEGDLFRRFTPRDGLPHNLCYFAVEDTMGYIWIGTARGVSRFDGQTFRTYTTGDGLVSDNMNKDACLLDAGGSLWFGTSKGLSRFNPRAQHRGPLPDFPLYITRIKNLDRDILPGKLGTLPYRRNHLRFDFIGLYFYAPERITYQYRLKGLSQGWLETNLRSVEYSYLPPADYTFQVKAGFRGGTPNRRIAEVTFSISPPYWRSWWFILAALSVFAILSYLAINFSKKYIVLMAFWRKKQYVGHYRLLGPIGTGGMGSVYKAENLMDKSRPVALKVLRDDAAGNEVQRRRFVNEAVTIDQIRHPNIVKIYERGEHNRQLYIAMEFIDGLNLGEKIEKHHPIPLEQCRAIARQLAGALAKIHEKGVIHRDLKPENIMILEKPGLPLSVKLLDFGLARLQFQSRITQTGQMVGTIHYMSPEQFRRGELTFAHDVYSFGVLFYEMVTGRKPFQGDTGHDILVQILEESPPPPRKLRPDLPVPLNNLIISMMSKDQEKRPGVAEVIRGLG